MIIKNTEKQILQKHYAERVKNLSGNLSGLIQQDNQEVLAENVRKIYAAGSRIIELQDDFSQDLQAELKEISVTVTQEDIETDRRDDD